MFVVANFLLAIAKVADILLTIYLYIIIARAIISWVNPDPYNPIVNFLYRSTEPVLSRVRRVLPDLGGLDLSPILVLVAIYFIQSFVIRTIYDFAFRMKLGTGAM
ncbi:MULTISPECIES: YggT family protein [Geobacter]|uniref:YggT family protein n=1 Tax=Geobacter TaxID=28231 RepID=UPI0025727AE1|nr:YggT family protein [Geobacter sulfurreducens]BEH11133.1 YggT family protein [Geobacter sulfurreducens subsp. ethanolicus]BET58982.1 YggT family protein [Geobacter sp. 60473]HML79192.1 YggT family protein [Geobacter sulfurreducens]